MRDPSDLGAPELERAWLETKVLTNGSRVAIAIEANTTPPKVLLIRG